MLRIDPSRRVSMTGIVFYFISIENRPKSIFPMNFAEIPHFYRLWAGFMYQKRREMYEH